MLHSTIFTFLGVDLIKSPMHLFGQSESDKFDAMYSVAMFSRKLIY